MQYSKIIPVFTGIIFVISLFVCILKQGINYEAYSIYVTAITASGGCFGLSIVWYMKKSQAENVYKLKKDLYRAANKEQIVYAKEMMELKKKYKVTDEDINKLNFDSQLDEFKQQALMDTQNHVDNAMSEATVSPEMTNINNILG